MLKLLKTEKYGLWMHKKNGLTLLEVILAVAILAILGISITSSIITFSAKGDLDAAILTTVASLRRAVELSKASSNDSSWGIKLATSSITIFKGNSFALRDSTFDEVRDISDEISITGANEFVFSRLEATTTVAATTTLTDMRINESRNVSINTKGMIDY